MYIGALNLTEFLDSLTMTFVSGYFLVFVALVVVFYYLATLKNRWMVLLTGSVIFSLVGGITVFLIPFFVTIISYCAAIMIAATDKNRRRKRRAILTIAAVVFLTALAIVKLTVYYGWGSQNYIFPVGISYYSFSMISYLADVYWSKDKPERNFFKLLLFALYFPKILQGPIARHRTLGPQLIDGHAFCYTEVCYGMQLMLWGYVKKMIIADRLNIVVQAVMGNYEEYGGCLIFLMLVLGAVQLYCDFSGCMDIAAGISQMCGIALEKNFNHPFFSKSAAEFWRHWHITLGTWFKDYVYMPIVISPKVIKFSGWCRNHIGLRVGKAVMTVLPLSVVWILTGLWHGTGINYVLWGVYWGTLIILSTLFGKEMKKFTKMLHINTESPSWHMVQMVRTFFLFCIGRMISMTESPSAIVDIMGKFIKDTRPWELFDGTPYALGLDRINFQIGIVFVMLLWAVEVLQTKHRIRESISKWNVVIRAAFYSVAFLAVIVLGIWGPSYNAADFVYMNF